MTRPRACAMVGQSAAMEPAPQERDDAGVGAAVDTPAHCAAMEPAPQERDDRGSSAAATAERLHAAMEPAPQERDDRAAARGPAPSALPQWSPLLRSGMTRRRVPPARRVERAAMEPAPQERDDRRAGDPRRVRRRPQWSPLLRSGMTSTVRPGLVAGVAPQWSPLLRSGMTGADRSRAAGRRGAAMEPAPQERDDAARRR